MRKRYRVALITAAVVVVVVTVFLVRSVEPPSETAAFEKWNMSQTFFLAAYANYGNEA
jgi:hypothetical protein